METKWEYDLPANEKIKTVHTPLSGGMQINPFG